MRQLDLFRELKLPRKPYLKRMRVKDAGELPDGKKGIQFVCPHCGHDTGWCYDEHTVTENKRGLPCPSCNEQQTGNNHAPA